MKQAIWINLRTEWHTDEIRIWNGCQFWIVARLSRNCGALSIYLAPSKHKTFARCCCDLGPPSAMLAQIHSNIGSTSPARVSRVFIIAIKGTVLCPIAGPDSYRLGIVTCRYQARIPVGPDIYHRGCAYTVLQTVQMHGVYSAVYGTVHAL